MKSRCSGYSSDSEKNKQKDDLSLLRKPIYTALSGFLEAKKAYENGTEEIRRLLSRECDIIYECNSCRNIFRSLTNFISHKRVYCRNVNNHFTNSFNPNQNGFIDQDVSTIIQAEQDFVNHSKSGNNNNNHNNNGTSSSNGSKDLSSIIERLMKREQTNRLMKLTDFYDQVNNKLTQDELLQKKHVLQLERVPNSSVAVYQTVKKDDADNIKTEVNEVHSLENVKTVLGPDGKAFSSSNFQITACLENSMKTHPDDDEQQNQSYHKNDKNIKLQDLSSLLLDKTKDKVCEICKLKFSTEKTLKLHIQAKHITSTFVFQCPSCSLTFLQPSAVMRHLSNDHKKSIRRIRMMRETIYKRRVRRDEVQIKGPSRELARLQNDKDEREAENNKAWIDNMERPSNSPMCTYCGKTFERKAVLTTHLNNCQMKNKSSSSNLATKKVISSDQNITLITKSSSTSTAVPSSSSSSQFNLNSIAVADDPSSKSNSNSNSVDSFDLEQRYDINGDSKDSSEIITSCKDDNSITLVKENRRKRRKPPKVHLRNDDFDSDTLNEMFANLGKNTDELSLKTVSLDNLTKAEVENQNKQLKEETQQQECEKFPKLFENGNGNEEDTKTIKLLEDRQGRQDSPIPTSLPTISAAKTKFRANHKQLPCLCKICEKRFDALSNLRRHISMFHYRRRKFGCKLCDYRAFRKYDVLNHLGSSHAITGEKETTAEYVMVHEDKYLKDDVDEDIILITNDDNNSCQSDRTKTVEEKRQRRQRIPKATLTEAIMEEPPPRQPERTMRERNEKFTRSALQQSLSSSDDFVTHKRPIRNRVKPVNKDFVYDLSNLLKKDMIYAERESLKSFKRRNTVALASGASLNDDSSRESLTPLSSLTPPIGETEKTSYIGFKRAAISKDAAIKGAAQRIATLLVSQGRAAFATLPELPTERPLMRSRLLSSYRSDDSVPVIETADLEEAQYKATLSEDSFIDKFSKRRKIDFKMKPRLSLAESPLSSLLLKVDMNVNCASLMTKNKFNTETTTTTTTYCNKHIGNGNLQAPIENELAASTFSIAELTSTEATINGSSSSNEDIKQPIIPEKCNNNNKLANNANSSSSSLSSSNALATCSTSTTADVANEVLHNFPDANEFKQIAANKLTSRMKKALPFVEPQPSIPMFTSPPPTPTKRITLFQRLSENKTKKLQDSLLRSALEN